MVTEINLQIMTKDLLTLCDKFREKNRLFDGILLLQTCSASVGLQFPVVSRKHPGSTFRNIKSLDCIKHMQQLFSIQFLPDACPEHDLELRCVLYYQFMGVL